MPAKVGVAIPGMVEAFVKLVIGIILAAVFLALGYLAFIAIIGEKLGDLPALSGTGFGIVVGAVVIGASLVVGATLLSMKK
ncbi:MAG: hypothetical protein QMD00_03420 [Hadesarchaea archaeon]|nr:hypothetical protein [Hadesarchaea archaeon]